MHFSLTGQYTPQALNSIMDNPTVSRYEAAKNLMEAAGGKLIAMYSTQADGPGVLAIFDVPDPSASAAIAGVVIASGALTNAKLTRLYTQDEIVPVRKKASSAPRRLQAARQVKQCWQPERAAGMFLTVQRMGLLPDGQIKTDFRFWLLSSPLSKKIRLTRRANQATSSARLTQ